jgi:hypothetical protein
MKYITNIIAFLIFGLSYGQSGNDTFLFIQDHLHVDHNFILSKEDYAKYKNEISIDTSANDRHGQYKVWIISEKNSKVRYYSLPDSSSLILGRAKDLLRRMEFSTGIAAENHFANLIADSLQKKGTYFFTYPELSTNLKYELVVVAWLKYPDSLNNLEYEKKRDAMEPYFRDFYEKFHHEFIEYGKENIQIFSMMAGHIRIVINLKNDEFPLKKLEKFDLKFEHKPKVKPRIFEFMLLEE